MGALKTQEAHCWFNLQGKELLEEGPEDQLLCFSVSAAAATSQHGGPVSSRLPLLGPPGLLSCPHRCTEARNACEGLRPWLLETPTG